MSSIYFLPQASIDLEETIEWYETQRVGLGIEFILEIDSAVEKVQENPQLYRQVHRNVRRIFPRRFPYAIYFVLVDENIHILAILHQSRADQFIRSRLG